MPQPKLMTSVTKTLIYKISLPQAASSSIPVSKVVVWDKNYEKPCCIMYAVSCASIYAYLIKER
jgi:hypothetical protein